MLLQLNNGYQIIHSYTHGNVATITVSMLKALKAAHSSVMAPLNREHLHPHILNKRFSLRSVSICILKSLLSSANIHEAGKKRGNN